MGSGRKSLRAMVEDWLAPAPGKSVRVSQFKRSRSGAYVCVEADSVAGHVSMFFFRHDDGSWCVFPPSPKGPAMRAA
nr:hypothetical protein [Paraburkholderia phenoliruptrix]